MSSKFQASLSFLTACLLTTAATAKVLEPKVLKEFTQSDVSVTLHDDNVVQVISVERQKETQWVFSLAITSFECDNEGAYVEVVDSGLNPTELPRSWNYSCSGNHQRHSSGNEHLNSIDTLTNLSNATIRLSHPNDTTLMSRKTSVSLIAAMYFEPPSSSSSCTRRGQQYFDCTGRSVLCPKSGPNGYRYIEFDNPNSAEPRRCIPRTSICNDVPSCGFDYNIDEHDAVCHPDEFCQLIFDWAFIVTRSLVAVIFILIPTVVIFLLFHRRQVALQRARLLRERTEQLEAQRSIEIITMQNKYANDLPPTYDDLYDTKDPPPCFCAVQASASPVDNSQLPPTTPDSPASHANPSFECTCQK